MNSYEMQQEELDKVVEQRDALAAHVERLINADGLGGKQPEGGGMRNANAPAMPGHEYGADGNLAKGLTKREYFAALAMQGLCSASQEDGTWSHDEDIAACAAIKYADALLYELERQPNCANKPRRGDDQTN